MEWWRGEEQGSVCDRLFTDAGFVGSGSQEVDRESGLKNGLLVQLEGEAGSRTEMVPVDFGAVYACAARAIAEFVRCTGEAAGTRVSNLRIEVHDGVVFFREWHHNVPTHAEVHGEARS